MKRRDFLKGAASAAAGAVLGGNASGDTPVPPRNRPNVLYIVTDQQHAQMMSCAGNSWLKTPAMDALAASGIRFDRAYSANPVCMPSRFALQTGRMPSRIGMETNQEDPQPGVTEAMREQALGAVFRGAGYDTVYGGKTHFPKTMTNVKDIGYRCLTPDSRQGLADACAGFIKEKHDRPFFLFASFINPHDICYMAINDYRRSTGEALADNKDAKTLEAVLDRPRGNPDLKPFVEQNCPPLPPNHAIPGAEPECIARKYVDAVPFRAYVRQHWSDTDWRLHRWAYCRLVERVDAEIGKVMDALREAKLEDNTLIVFTSDHGDMDAAHKLEHKSVLYEESVHIPLVLSHRGEIPAGKVDSARLVSNGLDLFPTLCDYAGIKMPEGLPGMSLRSSPEAWRDFVVAESQNGRMLRTDRFKYCVYDSGQHREQLTDMHIDPGEMTNLAEVGEFRPALEEHRKRLRAWATETQDHIAAQYLL